MTQKDRAWIRIKEPTASMLIHYKKLYMRNQSKWMRRSKLTQDDFGKEFEWKGEMYRLIGAVDSRDTLLVCDLSGENYYYVHSDTVDSVLLAE